MLVLCTRRNINFKEALLKQSTTLVKKRYYLKYFVRHSASVSHYIKLIISYVIFTLPVILYEYF